MGKGKKAKKYKAPDSKYLVVIDPWGTPSSPYFINNIAAWFEIMLKDDYPHEDVKAIFTQGTHNNIIVELSDSVDIEPYIGIHHHAMFLKPPYNQSDQKSYIYEYDYETQQDPTRRSWTAKYPTQYDITIFPIKYPYPLPSPAPPPTKFGVSYAKRPKTIQPPPPTAKPSEELPKSIIPTFEEACTSPDSQLPQDKLRATTPTKKRDPYEEADDVERFLKSSLNPKSVKVETDPLPSIKKEESRPQQTFIKREPDTAILSDAESLLNSIIPVKKEEPVDHLPLPSSDHVSVKVEQDTPQEDDYEPSDDLLAAFADLNQATASLAELPPLVKNEEIDEPLSSFPRGTGPSTLNDDTFGQSVIHVKAEPMDNFQIPSSPLSERRDPRIQQRERSTTLATERGESTPPAIRVKAEPLDDVMIPSRDTYVVSKTRDPRLLKREGDYPEHLLDDERERARRKRIKSEWETY